MDGDSQSNEPSGNEDFDNIRKSSQGVTGTTPPSSALKELLELGLNGNGELSGRSSPPSPLGGKPKSLVDMIQMDFPRTPSPVYQKRDLLTNSQQLLLDQQQGRPSLTRRASLQSSGSFYNDDAGLSSALQNLSVGNEVNHTAC